MKINKFTAVLSILLACFISFFLSFYVAGNNKIILSLGCCFTLTSTLCGVFSFSFDYDRTTTLVRVISSLFLTLLLVSQIYFTYINNFLLPTYILATGGLTVIYTLCVYGISRSKH